MPVIAGAGHDYESSMYFEGALLVELSFFSTAWHAKFLLGARKQPPNIESSGVSASPARRLPPRGNFGFLLSN
jgi:hypothetical protein